MIEPNGPLPPEIYWRRRIVAGVVALAVVGLIIGLIIVSTGKSDNSTPAAATSTPSALPSVTGTQSVNGPSGGGTGGGGSGGTGGTGGAGGESPASPAPGEQPAAGSASVSSEAPAEVPATGLCPDQNISVVLYTDKPTYTVGAQPVFTIVTTNAGLTACTRDVGKAAQNVIVRTLDGTRTLWTARDCSPLQTVNNVNLQPAQQVRDDTTWSGTTSNPGCNQPRVPVGPGSYQAIAKIGEKESAPITFNVVAPAEP